MRKLSKAWNVFTTTLVILVVVVAVGLVGIRLLGFKPLYVMSGSMKPAFPVGSLIFVQKTAPEDIQVGDPITYTINDVGDYSTHRVIAVESYETSVRTLTDEAGQPLLDENGDVQYEEYALEETCYYFQTKGDANELPDGTPVYYKNVVGVPRLTIPYLGYFAQWLQTPKGRILGISVALVIVILTFLPDLLKWVDEGDKKKEAASANEEADAESDAEDGE